MHRLSTATLIGFALIAFVSLPSIAHAQSHAADRPAMLQPPARTTADAFSAQDATGIGLRRPAATLQERTVLLFGLNYNRETKSLLMPLDEKNEWGLGLNLNLNSTPAVELAPSGIHFSPRRMPGLILHKTF